MPPYLQTVPLCQNLYRNSFTYHCLQEDKTLQFDDAIQFLEQCEREKARVLVHCMSGKSRSAAFVIAFLMKSRGWRLAQSFQWVKERRPQVQLSDGNFITYACLFWYLCSQKLLKGKLLYLLTVMINSMFQKIVMSCTALICLQVCMWEVAWSYSVIHKHIHDLL